MLSPIITRPGHGLKEGELVYLFGHLYRVHRISQFDFQVERIGLIEQGWLILKARWKKLFA